MSPIPDSPVSAPERAPGYPIIAYVLLAIVGFASCYEVTKQLESHGALRDWDIWFNSDPNFYLDKLEHGAYTSKRHPLVYAFVYLPTHVAAGLTHSITGLGEASVQHELLLLGTPLMAAAKTIFLLLLFSTLGLPLEFACLIALIDIASASRLAFGSIPESFGPTSTMLTFTFYLAAQAILSRGGRFLALGRWFATGFISFGITLTNIFPFGILFLTAWPSKTVLLPSSAAIRQCALLVALVLTAGGAISIGSDRYVSRQATANTGLDSTQRAALPHASVQSAAAQPETPKYIEFKGIELVRLAPQILSMTFYAPQTQLIPTDFPAGSRFHRARQLATTSYSVCPASTIFAVLLTVALGLGGWGLSRGGYVYRRLGIATLLILLFNWIVFTFWGGHDYFMFTLHWQPCLLLILAGIGILHGRVRRIGYMSGLLILLTMIPWNIRFFHSVLAYF